MFLCKLMSLKVSQNQWATRGCLFGLCFCLLSMMPSLPSLFKYVTFHKFEKCKKEEKKHLAITNEQKLKVDKKPTCVSLSLIIFSDYNQLSNNTSLATLLTCSFTTQNMGTDVYLRLIRHLAVNSHQMCPYPLRNIVPTNTPFTPVCVTFLKSTGTSCFGKLLCI